MTTALSFANVGIRHDAVRVAIYCKTLTSESTVREWIAFANDRLLSASAFRIAANSAAETTSQIASFQKQSGMASLNVAFIEPPESWTETRMFIKGGTQDRCIWPPPVGPLPTLLLVLVGTTRNGGSMTTTMPIRPEDSAFEGALFATWAAQVGWPIAATPDGQPILLASTAAVPDIGDKTPLQAFEMVREKLEKARGQASILGISVPRDLAIWLGPIILFALVAYLFAHVIEVERLSRVTKVVEHSWPALFPGCWSTMLTCISLALPPFVQVAIFYRASSLRLTAVEWCVQGSLLLAMILVSTLIWGRLRKVKRQLYPPPQKLGNGSCP